MPTTDPRVDAYLDEAEPFAEPILRHLRGLIHEVIPEVEETIKWNFPHFVLPGAKGKQAGGTICSFAAFKEHCTLAFWNAPEVVGDAAVEGAMGEFGRITSLDDLPDEETLRGYLSTAVRLRASGAKDRRMGGGAEPRPEPAVPRELAEALAAHDRARATWEGFPPSHRREYVEWLTEAKRETTREKRLAQALEWLAEGKDRNWKYR